MSLTGLFGGSRSNQSSSSNPEPWSTQQPFLEFGYNQAQDIYNAAQGSPYFQGPTYAQLNPQQRGALDSMYSGGGNFVNAIQSGIGPAMANLNAGGYFGGNAQGILEAAGRDPTQSIIGNAGQYADNPYMSGMIQSAARDDVRNVTENVLPSLNDRASATGNAYSSRTGVAQGIVERGLQDRVGDISANLRGNAYSQGLGMAQGQHNQTLANQMNANAQIGQAGQIGSGSLVNLTGAGSQAHNMQTAAGGAYQQDQQGQLDESMRQWMGQDQRAMDLLGRYWGVAGSGGYLGQASQSHGSSMQSQGWIPGLLNSAGSLLSIGGTAMGMFGQSDIRVKEDIKRVGKTDDGFPVYTFKYKHDDQHKVHMGVMAQDVEKVKPEAVKEFGGIKHVNYSKIGRSGSFV